MTTQIPEGEIAGALATLQNLSDEEIRHLIDDDTHFENYILNLAQVKQWDNEKDLMMASNKSLAEYNLTYESKLKEGKTGLMELYEKARSLTDELETKRAQLESLSSRTSLDTTYALLQTASAEAEEESETITEQFLSGGMETEAFISKFVAQRTNAHLRRLKSEKMGELVSSQRNRPSFNAPYPTGPGMPMPMPGMM